jgi:hypothetical protein
LTSDSHSSHCPIAALVLSACVLPHVAWCETEGGDAGHPHPLAFDPATVPPALLLLVGECARATKLVTPVCTRHLRLQLVLAPRGWVSAPQDWSPVCAQDIYVRLHLLLAHLGIFWLLLIISFASLSSQARCLLSCTPCHRLHMPPGASNVPLP